MAALTLTAGFVALPRAAHLVTGLRAAVTLADLLRHADTIAKKER